MIFFGSTYGEVYLKKIFPKIYQYSARHKLSYKLGYNILEPYNVLVQIELSKTKRDITVKQTWYIPVA